MHILYKITYLPHIGTKYPKYYVGSKYNYKGNYYGSVSSKKEFEYTGGLSLRNWWNKKIKEERDCFKFEIIETFNEEITPNELAEKESKFQIEHGCIGDDYFNQCFACGNFVSSKNDYETKKLKSEKTKKYWDTPAGIEKRKRLSERNKKSKSAEMKRKWNNERDKMMLSFKLSGRKKGSKDIKTRKKRICKQIKYKNEFFENAEIASDMFGITPTSIRRKCKLQIEGWKYV